MRTPIAAASLLLSVVALSSACGDSTSATGSTTGEGGTGDGGNGQGPATVTSTNTGPGTTTGTGTGPTTTASTGTGPTTTSGGGEGPTTTTSGGGEGGEGPGTSSGGGEGGAPNTTSSGGGEGGDPSTTASSASNSASNSASSSASNSASASVSTSASNSVSASATTVSASSGSGSTVVSSSSGGPVCTVITADDFVFTDYNTGFGEYGALTSPNIEQAGADALFVQFFDDGATFNGADTGAFDLSAGADGNYSTCSRCLLGIADFAGTDVFYFQDAGTLTITAASDQMNGEISATLTSVTLVEVTIDGQGVSTPVPNGSCVTITDTVVAAPPNGWTCDSRFYGTLDGCDCECGAYDPDCDFNGQGAIGCDVPNGEWCSLTADGTCEDATPPNGWTCDPTWYVDGGCDCGCGVQDYDCATNDDVSECDFCIDCQTAQEACADVVDNADTTQCG